MNNRQIKKHRGKGIPTTDAVRESVLKEFYRAKYPEEDVVDNSDRAIAKKLALSETTVALVLQQETRRVFREIDSRLP
jgi:hypothetical protein